MESTVIGIAGGSGSGKTTFARNVIGLLGEENVTLFQHDAYYFDFAAMPEADRAAINFDHPDALDTALCAGHLALLRQGKAIEQPVYDFSTHSRREERLHVPAKPVILVEGILVLADAALRDQMDLRIFVDADADLRILRRAERDVSERGRTLTSVREQYCATVRPMHEQFVAPSRQFADLVVPRGGDNPRAVEAVVAFIYARMQQ
ncbi:MAG: uridine kinase [Bacteroidia bacterium]|nr:uridine kinase [Bacteroidia bacterium]